MTIALCTKCGAKKFGAFSPCKECGFVPTSYEERAKSVMLSDHHHTRAELDEIGESIKAGTPVVYDSSEVARQALLLQLIESNPDALQCEECGQDLDSLDDGLCPNCTARSRS